MVCLRSLRISGLELALTLSCFLSKPAGRTFLTIRTTLALGCFAARRILRPIVNRLSQASITGYCCVRFGRTVRGPVLAYLAFPSHSGSVVTSSSGRVRDGVAAVRIHSNPFVFSLGADFLYDSCGHRNRYHHRHHFRNQRRFVSRSLGKPQRVVEKSIRSATFLPAGTVGGCGLDLVCRNTNLGTLH
jgi:hypothetical protein